MYRFRCAEGFSMEGEFSGEKTVMRDPADDAHEFFHGRASVPGWTPFIDLFRGWDL